MQLQRFWRVVLTGAILVALWWWTTVSAGADGTLYNPTAPFQPVPAGIHTSHFNACNPGAWWAFLTADLRPCVEASQRERLPAPIRTGYTPR